MPDDVAIAGEGWRPDELSALGAAPRALFPSAIIAGRLRSADDPLRMTVDGRLLWALGTALDGPYGRREHLDPALADDGAAAA